MPDQVGVFMRVAPSTREWLRAASEASGATFGQAIDALVAQAMAEGWTVTRSVAVEAGRGER